ncbi:MAG: ribonuclease P protein component [Acidobacteria bacterium]|nr:ribonuclease P protein component [Acidobacteriota bacterium]
MAPDGIRLRRHFAAFSSPSARAKSGPVRVSYVRGPDPAAVAFAIGKPVGNAVTRNRIRRRLRAQIDLRTSPLPPGYYLVKCGIGTEKLTYDELQHHLYRALNTVA